MGSRRKGRGRDERGALQGAWRGPSGGLEGQMGRQKRKNVKRNEDIRIWEEILLTMMMTSSSV